MSNEDAFKKAYPNMKETHPLYSVIASYFNSGLEMGKKIQAAEPRRKWVQRAGDRGPINWPTGPLNIQVTQ